LYFNLFAFGYISKKRNKLYRFQAVFKNIKEKYKNNKEIYASQIVENDDYANIDLWK
jgi:hypothetical protein